MLYGAETSPYYLHLQDLFFLTRSKDEEIDLVPVDQFYSEAPEDISKPVSEIMSVTLEEHCVKEYSRTAWIDAMDRCHGCLDI